MNKEEKAVIVRDGIFIKIVVTEENKIYMLYSNPIMNKIRIETKKIEADE